MPTAAESGVRRLIVLRNRPWLEFLSPSALRLPSSFSDARARVSHNFTLYHSNYFLLFVADIYLVLRLNHSFHVATLFYLFASLFIYIFPHETPTLFGFPIPDPIWVITLGLIQGFILEIFLIVFIWIAIGALVVFLHAVLRRIDEDLRSLMNVSMTVRRGNDDAV